MKKTKKWLLYSCTLAAMLMQTAGCSKKTEDTTTEATTVQPTTEAIIEAPEIEGYSLLWHDEFSGDKLDDTIWSYDPHEPGWTNNELQEYTTSEDNVYVADGCLTLKAIKTQTESGKDYYTSGKIKGQNKSDFMYGKVVISAKVPKGQGLWPALWMMPTDEGYYGQWPKCGEIDIMETLGHQTEIAYGTIHYGEPHGEQQGTYTLENATFADDFHEYSIEWEPGEIRWYIDGNLYHTVNDWFTAVQGEDDKPYPAPFNQTFFIQINLAVGGTWPGNPDATTDFENAEFLVDYVRVYQKPSYDTNVQKPEKEFRAPTEDGNLIYNGGFENEPLDDEELWYFLTFNGGIGSAVIEENVMKIETTDKGTVDYSIQLVQPLLPMIKGTKYRLSFDAKAEEERKMIVCVSAPTAGWVRYLQDTKLELGTDWESYTFDFEMTEKDDNNGRLEFNMGNLKSTATIYIRNVRIEVVEE